MALAAGWGGQTGAGDSWRRWEWGALELVGRPEGWAHLACLFGEWRRGGRIFFPFLPGFGQSEALGLPWTWGHSKPQGQARVSCMDHASSMALLCVAASSGSTLPKGL